MNPIQTVRDATDSIQRLLFDVSKVRFADIRSKNGTELRATRAVKYLQDLEKFITDNPPHRTYTAIE